MNTKNVLFLSLLLLGLLLVPSCSNDEDLGSLNGNTKAVLPVVTKSRVISKSEIPEGVKIFTVKNEAEEKALTNRLSKIKVLFVVDTDNDVAEHNANAQVAKSLERMADPESSSSTGWYVKIKVDLIYHGTKDPIEVISSAEIVGISDHTVKDWTETSSSAYWTDSFTAINYHVKGTVTLAYYIYNSETKKHEEKTKTYPLSISGTEQIL